jgi:phosphoglycolate phosphatase
MSLPLVVGFDLDMTLVDSRPGIAATYRALSAQTGVRVDAEAIITRLGPPLREELRHWFPPDEIEAAVVAFRALYPDHAVAPSQLLPGAAEAVTAVRRSGGRVAVITSKLGRLARLHVEHLGLTVDDVAGDRFAAGKAAAIDELGVRVFVGDHVADMAAARAAGVLAVGVTTGPCRAEELAAAGADSVLDDLTAFPAWLDRSLARGGIQLGSPATDG